MLQGCLLVVEIARARSHKSNSMKTSGETPAYADVLQIAWRSVDGKLRIPVLETIYRDAWANCRFPLSCFSPIRKAEKPWRIVLLRVVPVCSRLDMH